MADKSDNESEAETRVSATDASRTFSQLLDEVEKGRRFLVHRRGRDVCVMSAPTTDNRRATECLAILKSRSPVLLDDGFTDDLIEVLTGELDEERPLWDS